MATNVKSSLVLMRFSEVSIAEALSDVTAKFLMCEQDINWDATSDVTKVPTKNCGTFQVPQAPAHVISGTGVVAADLAANEWSSQKLLQLLDGQTTVFMAMKNDADGTITANEAVYRTAQGYFSSVGETWTTDDGMGKFTWEFTPNGAIDFTP